VLISYYFLRILCTLVQMQSFNSHSKEVSLISDNSYIQRAKDDESKLQSSILNFNNEMLKQETKNEEIKNEETKSEEVSWSYIDGGSNVDLA